MVPVTFSTSKTSELWEPSMFHVADNSNGRKLTDDMIKGYHNVLKRMILEWLIHARILFERKTPINRQRCERVPE